MDKALQAAGADCDIQTKSALLKPLFGEIDILSHARTSHPVCGLDVVVVDPIRLAHGEHPVRPLIRRLDPDQHVHSIKAGKYNHFADKALLRAREWRYMMEDIHTVVGQVLREFIRLVSDMTERTTASGRPG